MHPDIAWAIARNAQTSAERGEPMPPAELTGPRCPEGTPEYAAYATELRAELAKWSAGEPPYERPAADGHAYRGDGRRGCDVMLGGIVRCGAGRNQHNDSGLREAARSVEEK